MAVNKYVLYTDLAEYYDQLHTYVDYRKEAKFIVWATNKHKLSSGKKLLDITCGTGTHLALLKKQFDVTGLDISGKMLAIARRKLGNVKLIRGDMKKLDLGRDFDVIICMGAMNYNMNPREFQHTLSNIKRHLKPGGVFVFGQTTKESFKKGMLSVHTASYRNTKLIEIDLLRSDNRYYYHDETYLMWKGTRLSVIKQLDKLGLYSAYQTIAWLKRQGFDFKIYDNYSTRPWKKGTDEKPAFVCVKPL